MTDRTFNVDFNFLENCNYNASTTNKDINLPLQKPIVTVQQIGQERYYGDTFTIQAHITYGSDNVTNGVVDFYYINNDDYQTIRHKINTEPINIDRDGHANISFIPYKNCTIIAEYDGNPYFDVAEGSEELILNPAPTEIKFNNTPPYFVNPQDDVKLDVTVNDIRDNEHPQPIDYGIVTFLHYDIFDMNKPMDGQEHVIGNPTYLIDGQSSINYVPVQKDYESASHYNVELIRAIYNWQPNIYGVNWHKYYHMDSTYTAIALLKPNNININIIKRNSNNEDVELPIENGLFVGTNQDDIVLTFVITDENNDEIIFDNDAKLRINICGYDNDYEIQPMYAQYIASHHQFECHINSNLRSGIYYAYGVAIDNENKYLGDNNQIIITDDEGNTQENITNVDGKRIKNKIYLQSSETQHLYFQIKATEQNYNISFADEEDYIILEQQDALNVRINFTSAVANFGDILDGEICYIKCATLNQTYNTIIQQDEQGPYAIFDIIEKKEDENHNEYLEYNVPINIENNNDYIFYAYINTIVKDGQKYETKYSDPLIIKVRHNPRLTLSITPINSTYPGKVRYTLVGENIYQETLPITLTVDDDPNKIYEISLSQEDNIAFGYINDLLPMDDPGHIIRAETNKYNHLMTQQTTGTINKGTLFFNLNTYNNEIITSRNTNVIFGITEINNNTIKDSEIFTKSNEQINNISITFTKDNIEMQTVNISEQMTEHYLNLISNVNLCDDGLWNININYNGNSLYSTISQELDIVATRYTPAFKYTRSEYQLACQITNHANVHNNEKVLVVATFKHTDEDYFRVINITDNNGYCILEIPEEISNMEWTTNYADFTIEINPHLNVFETSFENYFNEPTDYINEDADIDGLYEQYQNNYELCLFTGYEHTTDDNNINNIIDIIEE